MAIALALNFNTMLSVLELGDNCIEDEASAQIAKALINNRRLSVLDLSKQ